MIPGLNVSICSVEGAVESAIESAMLPVGAAPDKSGKTQESRKRPRSGSSNDALLLGKLAKTETDLLTPYLMPKEDSFQPFTVGDASLSDRKISHAKPDSSVRTQEPRDETGRSIWTPCTDEARSYYYAYADHSPARNCAPGYLNESKHSAFAQIGNQKLISLRKLNNEPVASSDYQFDDDASHYLLADILREHENIKNIVDVGCGDAKKSLALQEYCSRELSRDITVFPVDVAKNEDLRLSANMLPGQEIKNGDPATTLFTVLHPFTDPHEGIEGDSFITTMLKNNPGCLVVTSEERERLSFPNYSIPAELVHTKVFDYNRIFLKEFDGEKAEAGQAVIRLMRKLPENKEHYLSEIPKIKDQIVSEIVKESGRKFEQLDAVQLSDLQYMQSPDEIFARYLVQEMKAQGIDIAPEGIEPSFLSSGVNWHIYKQ